MVWEMSPELLEKARKKAKELIISGEQIAPVQFGQKEDVIFVSSNHELVKCTDSFELEGTLFCVGTKR